VNASAPDRTLLVTGASSGIGRAVAELALARGDRVYGLDLGIPNLDHDRFTGIACDVRDADAVAAVFERIAADGVRVDGVVCSAGIELNGPVRDFADEEWDRVIDTNLTGTFLLCRAAVRAFRAGGRGGAIVCVSSPFARVAPRFGAAAYGASKAGVEALVRSLAVEEAAAGIRVNAIAPGATETPLMWANIPDAEVPGLRAVLGGEIPLGRLAQPVEPARVALWLLGDDAAYITGSTLICDGGVLALAPLSG
jgi:NAD(P)-dependent dehydrogenase (short-subunit alcohol dehydrogenase family)